MRVTSETARKFAAVDKCPSEDMFELIRAAHEEPQTFFDGGVWQGLDFSRYDMSKIRFEGAIVTGCIFRSGDISAETEKRCLLFQDNEFVAADAEPLMMDSGGDIDTGIGQLLDLVRSYNPGFDEDLLNRSYEFADRMHLGQFRHSGEPYMTHPLETAKILAGRNLDDITIAAALLHDVVEDTRATYEEILEVFGSEVADLVDGVTKLTNLQLSASGVAEAENYRKLMMAISRDVRVLLVKLADRLHNMRSIRTMSSDKQIRKAQETIDIYAPLAGRLGLQWMRDELEDLSFKTLNPDARYSIMRRFIKLQRETGQDIDVIKSNIEAQISGAGISAEVIGRAKTPYAVWKELEEVGGGFRRLSDIYTFYITTASEKDCYLIQGVLHQQWRAVPGTFKDYISQPKSNGYRAIHTTVSGRDGLLIGVQIQTRQMKEVAATGVSARWSYQEGERIEGRNPFAVDPEKWISQLNNQMSELNDRDIFLEAVRLEAYAESVFCFTPKGQVLKLPRGATSLDFAFAVHTEVGAHCVGSIVDGNRVPLWSRLRNGQSVEIITDEGQKPQAAWVDIAVTRRAKSAIRRSLREQDRDRYIKLGRELARVAFEREGKRATEKAIATAAGRLDLSKGDDVLEKLGRAELAARDVIEAIYPGVRVLDEEEVLPSEAIVGLPSEQTFHRSNCCQPIPGERIVGIAHRGGSLEIHRIDCLKLQKFDNEPERWIDVAWASGQHTLENTVTLEMTVLNEVVVLANLLKLIGEQGAKVSKMSMHEGQQGFADLKITVGVRGIDHLGAVFTILEAETEVVSVSRQVEDSPNLIA